MAALSKIAKYVHNITYVVNVIIIIIYITVYVILLHNYHNILIYQIIVYHIHMRI